jgi:hypothetical protein
MRRDAVTERTGISRPWDKLCVPSLESHELGVREFLSMVGGHVVLEILNPLERLMFIANWAIPHGGMSPMNGVQLLHILKPVLKLGKEDQLIFAFFRDVYIRLNILIYMALPPSLVFEFGRGQDFGTVWTRIP